MISSQAAATSHHRCKRPTPYLILTNISKRQNVKSLLQLAAAYGCSTIFVVGQKAFEFDIPDAEAEGAGSKTTDIPPMLQDGLRKGKMRIIKFDKLEECVEHIKSIPCCASGDCDDIPIATTKNNDSAALAKDGDANNNDNAQEQKSKPTTVPIIGVEIDNSSINLEEEPFGTTSVAFMMGNEGSGMTTKQMSVCDGFIRISQYGGGTASLNVSVAAGLVLHRFFHWGRGDVVAK